MRAPVAPSLNDHVVRDLNSTHRPPPFGASGCRRQRQHPSQPQRKSIPGTGSRAAASATCPQLPCNIAPSFHPAGGSAAVQARDVGLQIPTRKDQAVPQRLTAQRRHGREYEEAGSFKTSKLSSRLFTRTQAGHRPCPVRNPVIVFIRFFLPLLGRTRRAPRKMKCPSGHSQTLGSCAFRSQTMVRLLVTRTPINLRCWALSNLRANCLRRAS